MAQRMKQWPVTRQVSTIALVVTIPILVLVGRIAMAERSESEVKRLLKVVRQDRDPQEWAEAVRMLREEGGEAGELLDRELRRLHRLYLRDLKVAADRIDSLGGDAEPSAGAEAAREAWEEASRTARDFIFDKEKLPPAENEMVISEGWETAFRLGSEAERAFEAAERSLLPVGKGVAALSSDSAREMRDGHDRALQAFRRVGKELGLEELGLEESGVEEPEPEIREVAWAVLEIAEGRFNEVARRFRKIPAGRPRLVVFYAYSTAILSANDLQCKTIRRATRKGIRELNRYRMALGRTPLALNPKLMRAARTHSEEMRRLSYFSHDSPTPGRRTEGDRAGQEGYGGSVSENIYAASNVDKAIPVWKRSGKHHRTMTLPGNADAGISAEGPVTLVLGSGETGSPPVLVY